MRSLLLSALLSFCLFSANAQIINTIVGTGTAGSAGDGGLATAAQINAPSGISYDAAGNLYIAEVGGSRVRMVNASGVITTIAGTGTAGFSGDGGPATAAKINHPGDVAVDASGDIYFTDFNNNRVRKISGGIITTVAGTGAAASSGDGGPATAAAINGPLGIYFDASGILYIAALFDVRIMNLSSGIIKTYAGTGSGGYGGDGGPATGAQFNRINFMYMDPANNLYISDNGNHRIRQINSSGIINTIAGTGTIGFSGDGGPATNATINYPAGVVADASGNVYISDAMNYRIRRISTSGIITTYCGTGSAGYGGDGGPALAALLNYPQDLEFNAAGNLSFVDLNNNRIRKLGGSNYNPAFINRDPSLPVCKNAVGTPVNALLSIIDTDAGQTETWSIVTNPSHGTLGGFPGSLVSPGGAGTILPTGLTYTATTGYVGTDAFSIRIFDGQASDTIAIPVTVTDCHVGVAEAVLLHGNKLQIMPNPSDGFFNLFYESDETKDVHVIVTNILGQRVDEFLMSPNKDFSFHLTRPTGIYVITVVTGNAVISERIIIEN